MMLSGLGVAQAQTRHELHQALQHNRYQLHQAVQDGDWDRARHEVHQIRRDERRIDRRNDNNNNYYLQRNNSWNRPYYNHNTFYRYNRYRTYP